MVTVSEAACRPTNSELPAFREVITDTVPLMPKTEASGSRAAGVCRFYFFYRVSNKQKAHGGQEPG